MNNRASTAAAAVAAFGGGAAAAGNGSRVIARAGVLGPGVMWIQGQNPASAGSWN